MGLLDKKHPNGPNAIWVGNSKWGLNYYHIKSGWLSLAKKITETINDGKNEKKLMIYEAVGNLKEKKLYWPGIRTNGPERNLQVLSI